MLQVVHKGMNDLYLHVFRSFRSSAILIAITLASKKFKQKQLSRRCLESRLRSQFSINSSRERFEL